jgi:hypothetical protein
MNDTNINTNKKKGVPGCRRKARAAHSFAPCFSAGAAVVRACSCPAPWPCPVDAVVLAASLPGARVRQLASWRRQRLGQGPRAMDQFLVLGMRRKRVAGAASSASAGRARFTRAVVGQLSASGSTGIPPASSIVLCRRHAILLGGSVPSCWL